MPTSRYHVWMANLGPSERLLRAAQGGDMPWREFTRRYRAELFSSGNADAGNRTIRNLGQKFTLRLLKHLARRQPVTLLCHCAEDQQQCHRHVLLRVLRSGRV